jgi:hypothetical protein
MDREIRTGPAASSKPYFYSRIMCDPENPYHQYPEYWTQAQAQYQKDGKVVYISGHDGKPIPNAYIPVSQLRK